MIEAVKPVVVGQRTLAGAALSFWRGSIWLRVSALDGAGRRVYTRRSVVSGLRGSLGDRFALLADDLF